MEIIGRDKISQSGDKGTIKVDNRKNQDKGWLAKLIIGVAITVISAGIIYWLGWK